MLNIELVYNLYDSLTPDKKEELLGLLFKKSRQTMAYFKRSKDISLSKLEILADFYHMPLDCFRTNASFKTNSVLGNNNIVANIGYGANLLVELKAKQGKIDSLERELESSKTTAASKDDTIASKDDTIASKDEVIKMLRDQSDFLKAQIEMLQSK